MRTTETEMNVTVTYVETTLQLTPSCFESLRARTCNVHAQSSCKYDNDRRDLIHTVNVRGEWVFAVHGWWRLEFQFPSMSEVWRVIVARRVNGTDTFQGVFAQE